MTEQAMSLLRRRMIEDMTIRKFAPKTQHDYVQRVKDFAAFLGRSRDTAILEDVRDFQLRLASSGAGTPKINATVSALRFFFNVTLDRPALYRQLSACSSDADAGSPIRACATQESTAISALPSPAVIQQAAMAVSAPNPWPQLRISWKDVTRNGASPRKLGHPAGCGSAAPPV